MKAGVAYSLETFTSLFFTSWMYFIFSRALVALGTSHPYSHTHTSQTILIGTFIDS